MEGRSIGHSGSHRSRIEPENRGKASNEKFRKVPEGDISNKIRMPRRRRPGATGASADRTGLSRLTSNRAGPGQLIELIGDGRSVGLAPSRSNRRTDSVSATGAPASRAGLSQLTKLLGERSVGLVPADATGASASRALRAQPNARVTR